MKLKGKIAVISGASGGIGSEISKALAKEGVEVVLVSRSRKSLLVLKEEIESKGGKANIMTADLTDREAVVDLSDKIRKRYKKVDILIHCTGIGVYKKLPDITFEDWQASIAANVTSVFLLTQSLLPALEKSKRTYVIALGSGMGKIGVAGRISYCTSKFALRGLVLSLAKEYKKTNIKFCLLTLGSVLTSFGPLSIEQKLEKQSKGKKYLDPSWLAGNIVAKIRHDTLEKEVSIYPRHYFEESIKGKT